LIDIQIEFNYFSSLITPATIRAIVCILLFNTSMVNWKVMKSNEDQSEIQ